MNNFEASLRDRGQNLLTDTSDAVRSRLRPGSQHSTPPMQGLFEDLGTTWSAPSQARNGEPVTRFRSKKPKAQDTSVDELDLLSPTTSQESVRSKRSNAKKAKKEDGVVINGEWHAFHEDHRPRQLPSFKKKKPETAGDVELLDIESSQESAPPTQGRSRSKTPPLPRPPPRKASARRPGKSTVDTQTAGSSTAASSASKPSGSTLKRLSKDAPLQDITEISDDDKAEETPRPARERPKPRPIYNAKEIQTREAPSFPDLSPLGKGKVRESTPPRAVQDIPLPSPLGQDKQPQTRSRDKGKNKGYASPSEPMSSRKEKKPPPMRSQDLGKGRPEGKMKERVASNPIDSLSPLPAPHERPLRRSRSQSKLERAPLASPLAKTESPGVKEVTEAKPKRKSARMVLPESSDSEPPSQRSYAPFPMETQMLASIQRSPSSPNDQDLSTDEGDDPDEEELRRQRKKMRENPDLILAEIMRSDDNMPDEDDSLYIDPTVDPKTLCPWCDERLPSRPTPHLLFMIKVARRASHPDPRPTNSLGLQAPLTAFVTVCQRHKFESHQVPLAKSKGWPVEIDWQALSGRVQALKGRLQEILADTDERFLPGAVREDDDWVDNEDEMENRPRRNSVFWRDMVKSVRKKGARSLGSVREQFASFDKTQPGYYGELGYFIIHQTIYNLFPPSSIDPDTTLPLAPTDFIQLILVPEAAVSLVQEDLLQTRDEAARTLRESAEYGLAMFPDDHAAGSEAVQAGEQLVMERALARRRELKGEDNFEDELRKSSGSPGSPTKPRQRRARARGEDDEKSDAEVMLVEPRRSQRQPRKVSRTDLDLPSDSTSASGEGSPKRKAKAKGARDKDWAPRKKTRRVEGTLSRAAMEVLPVDALQAPVRPRPKPKPVVRELGSSQPQAPTSGDLEVPWSRRMSPAVPGASSSSSIAISDKEIIDVDSTPKANKRPFYPLQAAKERWRQHSPDTSGFGTAKGREIQSVKPASSSHTTEDEHAGSDVSMASRGSRATQKSRRKVAQNGKAKEFRWLLSDDSLPSSPRSLAYPIPRSEDSSFC